VAGAGADFPNERSGGSGRAYGTDGHLHIGLLVEVAEAGVDFRMSLGTWEAYGTAGPPPHRLFVIDKHCPSKVKDR